MLEIPALIQSGPPADITISKTKHSKRVLVINRVFCSMRLPELIDEAVIMKMSILRYMVINGQPVIVLWLMNTINYQTGLWFWKNNVELNRIDFIYVAILEKQASKYLVCDIENGKEDFFKLLEHGDTTKRVISVDPAPDEISVLVERILSESWKDINPD